MADAVIGTCSMQVHGIGRKVDIAKIAFGKKRIFNQGYNVVEKKPWEKKSRADERKKCY